MIKSVEIQKTFDTNYRLRDSISVIRVECDDDTLFVTEDEIKLLKMMRSVFK